MAQTIETAKINAAVDLLIEGDIDLSNALGEDGLIKQLSKRILGLALQAEMDDHLGYNRYDRSDLQNSTNGAFQKTLISNNEVIGLDVARDSDSDFEAAILKRSKIE